MREKVKKDRHEGEYGDKWIIKWRTREKIKKERDERKNLETKDEERESVERGWREKVNVISNPLHHFKVTFTLK